jgi:HlyD family secretion protein
VGKELAEIRGKLSELVEKRVAAEDQLKRIDIRAPQDGTVHQLSVHTVGGVIPSNGEPLMLIVPEADALTVEARIAPQEIDRVYRDQRAVLRFAAFNQRTTPELNATVSVVSADISTDPKTGIPFYTVRIAIPAEELARLNGLKLMPGMPVESFIQTEQRTVLSYLTKPPSRSGPQSLPGTLRARPKSSRVSRGVPYFAGGRACGDGEQRCGRRNTVGNISGRAPAIRATCVTRSGRG